MSDIDVAIDAQWDSEEYDDAGWTTGHNRIQEGISIMIGAGATPEEVAQAVENGIENAA